MRTKYYVVKTTERYGDYETEDVSLATIDSGVDLEEWADKFCMEQRGSDKDDWDEDLQGYWFDGNLVCYCILRCRAWVSDPCLCIATRR
jgi:hypothetical protein